MIGYPPKLQSRCIILLCYYSFGSLCKAYHQTSPLIPSFFHLSPIVFHKHLYCTLLWTKNSQVWIRQAISTKQGSFWVHHSPWQVLWKNPTTKIHPQKIVKHHWTPTVGFQDLPNLNVILLQHFLFFTPWHAWKWPPKKYHPSKDPSKNHLLYSDI